MANGSKRQSKLSIDLGGEQIDIIQLRSTESFSQAFHISVDMLASLGEIDLLPHLGKPALVSVSEDDVLLRHFHGLLTEGEFLEHIEGTGWVYRLTLRPRSHFHSQGRDFRIFQMMTTRDIVKEVLAPCGISVNFDKLKGGKRKRKYCVQYGESDFSFVSRLLEEEGIYYFYAHSANDHELTLCDSPSAHDKSTASPLTFNPSSGSVGNVDSRKRFDSGVMSFVQEWRERVESGSEETVTLRDFDFQKPNRPLEQTATQNNENAEADVIEVYDYPGRYYVDGEGKELAESLLAARRANRQSFNGSSKNAALACGTTFVLEHPDNKRYDGKKYLLTRCQHNIGSETYRSGMGGGVGHSVVFDAVPAETVWKSSRRTPRPVVWGPETAIVTGPAGEQIHCDKYGRIKVQFHWDRAGDVKDRSSCWIRVSQTGGLGNIILPRVGHEVLVDFINGDADRPIVVGRVFNEEHMPVYPLPDNKTRALWRTKTYKDRKPSGAAKALDTKDPGANELRFEDKEGAEEVFVHAQRDMNTRVQRNETHHLGHDLEFLVGNNRKLAIGADDTVIVDANRKTEIKKNETRSIKKNRDTTISGTELLKVSQSITIDSGTDILIQAGNQITLKVGGSTIVMKDGKIEIKTDMLTTKGNISAEHTGGSGSVKLNPGGVQIKGVMVTIN
jgi:type VI secretion system secreted protein VgrG